MKFIVAALTVTAFTLLCIIGMGTQVQASTSGKVPVPGTVVLTGAETYGMTDEGKTTATVTWQKLSRSCTNYQIYMKDEGGSWTKIKTVSASKDSAEASVPYESKTSFKVRAINKKKVKVNDKKRWKTAYGKFSEVKSVTPVRPQNPAAVKVTRTLTDDGAVARVKWSKSSSNVDSDIQYQIAYKTLKIKTVNVAAEDKPVVDSLIAQVLNKKKTISEVPDQYRKAVDYFVNPKSVESTEVLKTDGNQADIPVVEGLNQTVTVTATYEYQGDTYKSEDTTIDVEEPPNTEQWMDVLADLADRVEANNFYYNQNPGSNSYASAMAKSGKSRRINCAAYVSWALQEYGILPEGQMIWLGKTIHGNGAGTLKSSDKVTITYPGKVPSQCDLQPGDICGFQWGDPSANQVHTMVYAGNNQWYTAGTGDVRGLSGSRASQSTFLGPKAKSSYNGKKCYVLIRINN